MPIEPAERPTLRLDELRGADLKGQDLTVFKGLRPEHLAGADLTGAKLPDDIAKLPALDQVAAISSEARKIFIGLLAACAYSWLVIGTTTDVALIVNTASSPLPIINTPIPIAGFYVVAAALLAAVYCYLHFYLQYLWRMLATLPAVFPDGMALDDKSDPWLPTNFVRVYFTRLKSDKHPLKQLETVLSVVLAWVLAPLTLFALWARYLPSHDWIGTCWLVILTWFTTAMGWHFFRFARAALSGEAPPSKGPGIRGTWRELRALRWSGRTLWFIALVVVPLILPWYSYAAFHVNPRVDSGWAAKGLIALRLLGIRTYADLREEELAKRPESWTGNEWDKVKPVDLRGRNLAFADATGAFLANADLRGANLQGAVLASAELGGADLMEANLRGADLHNAKLQRVILLQADLEGARLEKAELEGSALTLANLRNANLMAANLAGVALQEAQLQGANISYADLQEARLGYDKPGSAQLGPAEVYRERLEVRAELMSANLNGARLTAASLKDADLRSTDLREANLSNATLSGADLHQAKMQGAILFAAKLPGADLGGADLRGARLEDAELQGADLREVQLQRASLRGAQLQSADLRKAGLQEADLTGVQLQGADLREAGLSRAIVEPELAAWNLADVRGSHLRPTSELNGGIPAVTDRISAGRSERPDFPTNGGRSRM
jgi:uncharacterized protein YjbI with pentapeptide repeats